MVSRFAADSPLGGQVQFENSGALTIGPLAGTGFDSASNTPTAISAPNTVSFGDLFVRTTGNLTLAANATIRRTAAGDATLRLNANNNIIAENTTRIESVGGRLNVEFNSDSDGNGSGAISLGTLTIQTNGGDVRMFGGTDPVNGRAQGNDVLPDGVRLSGTTIDTVPAAGGSGGAVVIRGQGGSGAPAEVVSLEVVFNSRHKHRDRLGKPDSRRCRRRGGDRIRGRWRRRRCRRRIEQQFVATTASGSISISGVGGAGGGAPQAGTAFQAQASKGHP